MKFVAVFCICIYKTHKKNLQINLVFYILCVCVFVWTFILITAHYESVKLGRYIKYSRYSTLKFEVF